MNVTRLFQGDQAAAENQVFSWNNLQRCTHSGLDSHDHNFNTQIPQSMREV